MVEIASKDYLRLGGVKPALSLHYHLQEARFYPIFMLLF